jgi:1,2-dihydroxy-3-keto-5-methylthiopentene dioxygenase
MTRLIIAPEDAPNAVLLDTEKPGEIAEALDSVGVRFEQWDAGRPTSGASDADVLAAFADDVDRITREAGYVSVDVARLQRAGETAPEWAAKASGARHKFLAEHTHADDEVRFFVSGRGAFYLRLDHKVHIVLCTAGDLLGVPAGTRHWFDMGTDPGFTALRFFRDPEGWIGDFTGDDIATRFPAFDSLVT